MEHFFASSPRGLEPLLAAELASLGAKNAAAVPGGVAFAGDWRVCYAANLWSRLASRVLWRVAEFDYGGEGDIYEAARSLAAIERSSIGKIISRLARRALAPPRQAKSRGGFPGVEGPDNVRPLTPEMVRDALDED